jgi:molecular chaperone DnaK
MNDTIAIDFGTMRTKLAYVDPATGKPELMRLGRDENVWIPSMFYLGGDGHTRLFGEEASAFLETEPDGVLSDPPLKRQLDRRRILTANGQGSTPAELLVLLFQGLRERASQLRCRDGRLPTSLVLTKPSESQYGPRVEALLKDSAAKAGFADVQLIDEPVAAACAWLAANPRRDDKYIVVLDCGGGTVDWACLHSTGDCAFEIYPEIPPSGCRLGGYDVDDEICTWLVENASDSIRAEIGGNAPWTRRRVQSLKEIFSDSGVSRGIHVAGEDLAIPPDVLEGIIRDRFTEQVRCNFDRVVAAVREKLHIAKPTVLLVGGSARLRGFQQAIAEQCNCNAVRWERSEYATVLGALISSASPRQFSTAEPTRMLPPEPTAPPTPEEPKVTVNDSLAQAQYEEAAKAMQSGNADAAIQKLTLCVMLSPSLSEARELLVNAFAEKNDLQSAMISAKAWTDASPDNPRAWATLGSVAFATGDFSTSALVLGRNVSALDAEGLLLLAASLFRQGKTTEVSGVLERIRLGETDQAVRTLGLFLLPWLKRGSDYGEADLRNYTEALAGWRSFTAEESAAMTSRLAWFGISLPNFILSTQIEMLSALLNLKQGNLRDALDALHHQCKGEIDFGVVWSSRDPDLLGRILASTLCRKGKIKEATDLVTAMCARNPTFDIRLVQGEGDFRDCVNDPRVCAFYEPALSVSENHGAVFNDVTVTNGSAYRVTNVKVRVRVLRQGGKSDAPFTVSFAEIAPGRAQSQSGVFKNAGWFGGDVEKVETLVVACDQQF